MINLLPQGRQKKIQREEMTKIATIIGVVFLAAFTTFVLMLLLVRIDYSNRLKAVETVFSEKEKDMESFAVKEFEARIAENDNLISKINDFYGRHSQTTDIFLKTAAAMPAGMTISRFNCVANKVSIAGFTSERAALVEFKNNLERQSGFANINFPSGNWLAAKDINFNADFEYVEQ